MATQMGASTYCIPAAVWACHHDRKAGDGRTAQVHVLGSTAIRAWSSANLGIRVVNEESSVMKAELVVLNEFLSG